MTREEKRREASIDYQLSTRPITIGGDTFADDIRQLNVNPSFIKGAEWADSHHANLWKDAQGDELPDYDREVVVLIQDYPDDEEHLRVAYGHRPNPNGYVTKDGERLYPMTYGKGGWNGKNVRYWLDVKLPNQDEL